jgi:hypothetical protein
MQWQVIDFIGVFGGILSLFAFWRINTRKWKVTSIWYELDNFIGSFILVIYTWEKHAYVNIVLNIIWGIVAFSGLRSFAERRLLRNPDYKRGFRHGRNSLKHHKKR